MRREGGGVSGLLSWEGWWDEEGGGWVSGLTLKGEERGKLGEWICFKGLGMVGLSEWVCF